MSEPATPTDLAPGIYDMPEDQYHADPVPGGSLSSSGAKLLLPPSAPAVFRYRQQHPERRNEFDLGHAAHKKVLGVGSEIAVLDFPNYKTKDAQNARDAAYAAGRVPLLPHEDAQTDEMAAAVMRHRIAGPLFAAGRGEPERTLIWQDKATGVWRRARLDWMVTLNGGRLLVGDLKSCARAALEFLPKVVHDFSYYQQAAWYLDGVRALKLGDESADFVFVFVEKTPPYLVQVVRLDDQALAIGAARNRQALEIFRDCNESGMWPGYDDSDIAVISLPAWAARKYEELY
ncbi:PD-(D/E)XK nuclease-like domain-containing protein [Micromonospora sp. CPCC 205371]|nr:PD-(D/E)XK nuclease-like domain-containing protein [Micromonospora sp. CPCC 205371]